MFLTETSFSHGWLMGWSFQIKKTERGSTNGSMTPEADFFNMTSFGKQAEFVEKYLRKGSKILVEGEIHNNTYTNKEGQKVYATQVITSAIEFAESKKDGAQTPTPSTAGDGFMSIPDGIDEELPFT